MTEQTHFLFSELQQKAEAGDALAQFSLGLYYLPKEVWESKEGWEFVDSLHSTYRSEKFVGPILDPEISLAFKLVETNNEANVELAFLWFKKAAEQGRAESQYAIARCYYEGKGTEQNDKLAFEWAKRSVAQEFSEAFCLLGDLYSQGRGVGQDDKQAYDFYEKAVNDDVKSAKFKKIKMLFTGKGIKDYDKGLHEVENILTNTEKSFQQLLFKIDRMYENLADKLWDGRQEYDGSSEQDEDEQFGESIDQTRSLVTSLFTLLKETSPVAINSAREIEETSQKYDQELEDMMSMFAHKFRSPLDAIIYNTTHDNQVKLYTEAAQTMRGLLNIFSIISTDADILKDKIKQDRQGSGRLATVFSKTLDMILLHLLSASGAEKIQQHYMAYAKAHGQCEEQVSYKTWCEDYFELEQALQAEWEQSFALLLNQSASLEQRLAWLEQHFFKLELIGVEHAEFQFKEYGVTESFITIVLNEILVNAFKYYSSASKQSVIVEWTEREGYQVLTCRNLSIRSERTIIKGSHKGHSFLSALARKTGSTFTKPVPQDEFVVEFGIPNELLISK